MVVWCLLGVSGSIIPISTHLPIQVLSQTQCSHLNQQAMNRADDRHSADIMAIINHTLDHLTKLSLTLIVSTNGNHGCCVAGVIGQFTTLTIFQTLTLKGPGKHRVETVSPAEHCQDDCLTE